MSAGDDEVRITLRLPALLRDHLAKAAGESGRSMNGEIVVRLEDSFSGEEKLWDEVNRISEAVESLSKKIDTMEPRVRSLWERSEP